MSPDATTQSFDPAPDVTGAGSREDPTAGATSALVPRRGRRRWSVLAALAAVALLVAWGPWRAQGDVRDGTTVVDRAGLAARHGIDVDLVAVTAAGGLVELRMQITDPDKANAVIHDPADRPVLVAEDTGQTLAMSAPPHHKATLELGREYFFLLANAHNALRSGSQVTVVVDDVRLEHVEVQG